MYYGKVAGTCQLGHWFSLFHQGGEMNRRTRSCFEPRSVPHLPYPLVKAAIFNPEPIALNLSLLHLLEQVGIGPGDRECFSQPVDFDGQATGEGAIDAVDEFDINDGAAVNTPELVRIQLGG